MSTTANGDGLVFDKRLPSVFEEVEAIKCNKKVIKVTRNDD